MPTTDCMIFIADGRFHIEVVDVRTTHAQSAMIMNPNVRALRYNPYSYALHPSPTSRMELTEEEYDLTKMKSIRSSQIDQAKKAKKWGIVLGTLGRQGNEAILERLKTILKAKEKEFVVVLLSELSDAVVSVT